MLQSTARLRCRSGLVRCLGGRHQRDRRRRSAIRRRVLGLLTAALAGSVAGMAVTRVSRVGGRRDRPELGGDDADRTPTAGLRDATSYLPVLVPPTVGPHHGLNHLVGLAMTIAVCPLAGAAALEYECRVAAVAAVRPQGNLVESSESNYVGTVFTSRNRPVLFWAALLEIRHIPKSRCSIPEDRMSHSKP